MKKYYLILDTETTEPKKSNAPVYPLAYDIGYTICDRSGNIVHRAGYVISDIFCDFERMANAYYGNKAPLYLQSLHAGYRTPCTFEEALAHLKHDCEKYQVNAWAAYNLAFDRRALRNTMEWLNVDADAASQFRNMPSICLWRMAADCLPMFNFQHFAASNGLKTEKGNIKSSAEAVGMFLFPELRENWAEPHTALEDAELETRIFAECMAKRKKIPFWPLKGDWRHFQPAKLSQWGRGRVLEAIHT